MKGTNGKFVEKISISFDCFWKWENNGRQTRGTMIIFSAQYFSNFGMSVCFLRMNYGKSYGPVYNGNMNRSLCISYLIESQRTLALAMLITGDTRKFRKSVPTSHTRGWLSLKVNWNTQNHITMITDPVSDNVYFTGRMQGGTYIFTFYIFTFSLKTFIIFRSYLRKTPQLPPGFSMLQFWSISSLEQIRKRNHTCLTWNAVEAVIQTALRQSGPNTNSDRRPDSDQRQIWTQFWNSAQSISLINLIT